MSLAEDIRRFLSLVPLAARRRDGAPLSEILEALSLSREELTALLDRVIAVGTPDGTPDQMVDVYLEGDRVFVALEQTFKRPPRFTREELLALLVALSPLRNEALPGVGEKASTLAARLIDAASPSASREAAELDERFRAVEADSSSSEVLATFERAILEHRWIEARYYSAHRDAVGERRLAPRGLIVRRGRWYVLGEDRKTYKVDRFEHVRITADRFVPDPALRVEEAWSALDAEHGGHEPSFTLEEEGRRMAWRGVVTPATRAHIRSRRGALRLVEPERARRELAEETRVILDKYTRSSRSPSRRE